MTKAQQPEPRSKAPSLTLWKLSCLLCLAPPLFTGPCLLCCLLSCPNLSCVLFYWSVIFILSAIFPDHSPVFNSIFLLWIPLTQLNSCVAVFMNETPIFSNGESKGRQIPSTTFSLRIFARVQFTDKTWGLRETNLLVFTRNIKRQGWVSASGPAWLSNVLKPLPSSRWWLEKTDSIIFHPQSHS